MSSPPFLVFPVSFFDIRDAVILFFGALKTGFFPLSFCLSRMLCSLFPDHFVAWYDCWTLIFPLFFFFPPNATAYSPWRRERRLEYALFPDSPPPFRPPFPLLTKSARPLVPSFFFPSFFFPSSNFSTFLVFWRIICVAPFSVVWGILRRLSFFLFFSPFYSRVAKDGS